VWVRKKIKEIKKKTPPQKKIKKIKIKIIKK